MNSSRYVIALATLMALSPNPAPGATAYAPYCANPQLGAPEQALGALNSPRASAIAWNGREYATFYHDRSNYTYYFRRVFADGTPAAPPVAIMASGAAYGFTPALVWTGTDYGAAWGAMSGAYFQIFFARFSDTGALLSGPTRVSQYGVSPTISTGNSNLAWSGTHFAVVWNDNRNQATSDSDVFATLLDASGAVAGGGALHDLTLHNGTLYDDLPTVAWLPGSGRFLVLWSKFTAGFAGSDIWGVMFNTAGSQFGMANPVMGQAGVSNANNPVAVSSTSGAGVSWTDTRDGNGEIYFARFSPWGAKLGTDVRVTNAAGTDQHSWSAWTGREYAIFYDGNPSAGQYDAWMARVSAEGVPQGSPWQVTSTGGQAYPRAAFGRYGFLLTHSTYSTSSVTGANFTVPISCAYNSTPTCPSQPVAYNVTGSGATLAWQQSEDNYNDIAYYEVDRNGSLAGRTSSTYFSDSGLTVGTTYQYTFRAVNSLQYGSVSCANGIYVRTGASLTLTVNKPNGQDAGLDWTDGGATSYAIFRGVTPQVMSQIGATPELSSTDPNALIDTVSYFYSIDNPGQ